MYSDEDGELAVRIARAVVEGLVQHTKFPLPKVPQSFSEKSGVFVTLTTHPGDALRGCIGFPEPIMPRIAAIKAPAVSAASRGGSRAACCFPKSRSNGAGTQRSSFARPA